MKARILKYFVIVISLFLAWTSANALAQSAKDSEVYIVKKRDTLSKISRKFGVTVKEIADLNSIDNPNKIKAGQVLLIPKKETFQAKAGTGVPTRKLTSSQTIPLEEEYVTTRPKRGKYRQEKVIVVDEEIENLEEEIVQKKSGDPHREVIGGGITGWFVTDIDADVQANSGIIKGTKINLQDTIGADDSVNIPVVNVWMELIEGLKVQGEYMEFGIDGARSISETIVFEGVTFSAADRVRGKADIQRASGWLEWNPFRGDWGYLGGLIGGEYIRLDAELQNDLSASVSGTIPSTLPSSVSSALPSGVPSSVLAAVPTTLPGAGTTVSRTFSTGTQEVSTDTEAGTVSLGGQARFYITDEIEMGGRVRAFSYEVSDIDFSFVDLQGEISYTIFDLIKFAGGYRALFLEVENDDVSGELTMHGPYISGSLRF